MTNGTWRVGLGDPKNRRHDFQRPPLWKMGCKILDTGLWNRFGDHPVTKNPSPFGVRGGYPIRFSKLGSSTGYGKPVACATRVHVEGGRIRFQKHRRATAAQGPGRGRRYAARRRDSYSVPQWPNGKESFGRVDHRRVTHKVGAGHSAGC